LIILCIVLNINNTQIKVIVMIRLLVHGLILYKLPLCLDGLELFLVLVLLLRILLIYNGQQEVLKIELAEQLLQIF